MLRSRLRGGRMFPHVGYFGLVSPVLHTHHNTSRTRRQYVVLHSLLEHPPQDEKLQLLSRCAGGSRLWVLNNTADGVAEQQHRCRGVQQGRLVSGPRLH